MSMQLPSVVLVAGGDPAKEQAPAVAADGSVRNVRVDLPGVLAGFHVQERSRGGYKEATGGSSGARR
jgi:hypothetical protein